jgi:hypothetical protein
VYDFEKVDEYALLLFSALEFGIGTGFFFVRKDVGNRA